MCLVWRRRPLLSLPLFLRTLANTKFPIHKAQRGLKNLLLIRVAIEAAVRNNKDLAHLYLKLCRDLHQTITWLWGKAELFKRFRLIFKPWFDALLHRESVQFQSGVRYSLFLMSLFISHFSIPLIITCCLSPDTSIHVSFFCTLSYVFSRSLKFSKAFLVHITALIK